MIRNDYKTIKQTASLQSMHTHNPQVVNGAAIFFLNWGCPPVILVIWYIHTHILIVYKNRWVGETIVFIWDDFAAL